MQKYIYYLALACCALVGPAAGQNCNRAVDATTPSSRFRVNDDGTATDLRTQLSWQRCPLGFVFSAERCTASSSALFDWSSALQAAEQSNSQSFAGFSDWRVPNVAELASFVEYRCSEPALNISVFPDHELASEKFWTSTPGGHDKLTLTVDFSEGEVSVAFRVTEQFPVRLVR